MSEETIYKAQERNVTLYRDRSRMAVTMIGGGLGLLALTLSGVNLLGLLAPMIFVGGAGLLLLWPSYRASATQPSRVPWLAGPGMTLLATGLLLFIILLIDRPEMMAYAWVIFPISLLGGMMYGYRHQKEHAIHHSGPKVIRVLGWIGFGAAMFFELLVFESLGPWWPLVLIGFGIYHLITRRRVEKV